jgi:hypothetical protein
VYIRLAAQANSGGLRWLSALSELPFIGGRDTAWLRNRERIACRKRRLERGIEELLGRLGWRINFRSVADLFSSQANFAHFRRIAWNPVHIDLLSQFAKNPVHVANPAVAAWSLKRLV